MTPPHLPIALGWLADARAAWEAAPTPEALDRYRRAMAGVLFLQGLASTDHRPPGQEALPLPSGERLP